MMVSVSVVACSAASQGPTDAAVDQQQAQTDASDASNAADIAADDVASQTDAQPNQGQCAACTANKCLAELQACGGSQGCTNDLVTFNDCLSADQPHCGTTFAAGGSAQASLWSCLASQCSSVCGSS